MEIRLFEKLKEAYETSSIKFNNFKEAIENIQWDEIFKADGEIYFIKDGFTLTVENLNPFEEAWRPAAFFKDGTVVEF